LGDFGICFIENDGEITQATEVMGSRHYCAPELRDGRAEPDTRPALADVYSLGKLLYWKFSGQTFDGHEEIYSQRSIAMGLANKDAYVIPFERIAAASMVDSLVSESVVRIPNSREIGSVNQFKAKVAHAIERVKATGRALNLNLPKRCLFCAEGQYRALHQIAPTIGLMGTHFPKLERV
jgi:serine/threonine protein kinase